MKQYVDQLENAEAVLFSLALGVEAKDPGLEHHCARLAHYATALGRALGLDAETLEALRRGGVLHDVGKIGVPDAILFKAGGLTSDEWQVMREHPIIGERICRPLKSMQSVLPIIRHHHERWNGSGYPDGLQGTHIPLGARIMGIVDVYDALRSARPHKGPLPHAEAVSILVEETDAGLWDPTITPAFVAVVDDLGPESASPRPARSSARRSPHHAAA
jgi:putative two-component system response regulator